MSKNRYGRIYHSDYKYINLRFESLDKRRIFEANFNRYHAEHEHDGEVPWFEEIGASEAIKEAVKEADSVTIDGYTAHEIAAYHEDLHGGRWVTYKPPTTCVPPIISIEGKFVVSDTLKRHELSAIFTDMPEDDYQSLLESVSKDGFMDPVIRLIGHEVLDGWHRYRAAKELNLLRKLTFRQWNENDEGDPAAFVLARNIERRHLTPGQRAQIVVSFNGRFGHGGDRSKLQNCNLKSQEELAKQANVSKRTISTAVKVEKAGESEAVIRGEKTAGEVLESPAVKVEKQNRIHLQHAKDAMLSAFKETGLDEYMGEDDLSEEIYNVYNFPDFRKISGVDYLAWIGRFQTITNALKNNAGWVQDLHKEFEEYKIDDASDVLISSESRLTEAWNPDDCEWDELLDAIEERFECDRTDLDSILNDGVVPGSVLVSLDEIKRWQSYVDTTIAAIKKGEDWIPTNEKTEPDSESEETVDSLWEKIAPAISAWKSKRKGQGVGHASKTMFIEATKCFLSEFTRNSETDVDLLQKLLDILNELHGPGYTFERYIKRQCAGGSIWEEEYANEDPEQSDALDKFKTQKAELYTRIGETSLISVKDEFGNANADKARHRVMVAAHKAYDLLEDLLLSDPAIEALSAEELRKMTSKYFLMVRDFTAPLADWVAELYQEAKIPKVYGNGTQGEFNASNNACNPTEAIEQDTRSSTDVWFPGVKVLSIKVVLSGHDDVWFEDDSRAPNAIPLSAVPEEVLAQLLMLTQDTNRLDAAAGEFVKAFNSKVDELRLSDYMILGALKEACTHYSCSLDNLLMLTGLFPDRFDAEDAKTYRERLQAPDINAWINTLKSMRRDVETCENWMDI